MNKKLISFALVFVLVITSVVIDPSIIGWAEDTSLVAEAATSGGDVTEDNEGITVSKYVTFDYTTDEDTGEITDSSYTLDLEVFTTGTVTTTEETETPADIVLVLDQSTSMIWPASQAADNDVDDGNIGIVDGYYEVDDDGNYVFGSDGNLIWHYSYENGDAMDTVTASKLSGSGNITLTEANTTGWDEDDIEDYGYLYSQSRQKDLIEAVASFIYSLDTEAGHRVSIVTYHNEAIVEYALTGDANKVTTTDSDEDSIYEYDYTAIIKEVVDWVKEENDGSESADGDSGDTTFNLEHSTLIALGTEEAESALAIAKYGKENYTAATSLTDLYNGTGRSQMSVIFTDGIPTQISSSGTATTDGSTANNVNRALEASYNMKQDGVTVFTIGMLNGVYNDYSKGDTTNANSDYYYDESTNGNYYIVEGDSFISSFLDLLSSNYVNAEEYIADDFPNSSNIYDVKSREEDRDYDIENTYDKTESTDEDSTYDYTEYYYPIDTDTDTDIAESLSKIFTTVASQMTGTATYSLDQTTQIRDVMTAEYTIPMTFEVAENASGDYDKDESTGTYIYVGTGGGYTSDVDIGLYISYCTGVNNDANTTVETADDYVTTNDVGYYTWSEFADTSTINDAVTVIVRNVYIDTRESTEDIDYGQYVYYYDDVDLYDGAYYTTDDTAHENPLTESQQVIVEGFNFNNYYVTTEDKDGGDYEAGDYGAKLVIEFEIEPNTVNVGGDVEDEDGTIGGNNIETNTTASGVYIYDNNTESGEYGYTSLESFPVPIADIPIDIDISVADQTIYLGNAISVAELITIDGHTIQGISNKYVDITYTLYQAERVDTEDESNSSKVVVDATTGEETTIYYKYVLDDASYKIPVYTVEIAAGESATDVTGTYELDTLIVPEIDMAYIVDVLIEPLTEGTVGEATTTSSVFSVYVLYPEVEANDIWVDYATPVNLREDNIIQVVDASGEITAFDNVRVSWDSTSSYDYIIPDPNNAIPPTVTFGFTARRGIEYTAAEFESYGVREDKEFSITSMTTTSSDGYNNTILFDLTDDTNTENDAYEAVTFDVNVNRFDLEINKTVDADLYDAYPQSFIFDVNYIGSEFVTTQKYVEDVNGYVLFESDNTMLELYVDTAGYDEGTGETSFTIYKYDSSANAIGTEYTNITAEFVTGGVLNTEGDNYITWDEENGTYSITYGGSTYTATARYNDDGTAVLEIDAINDIEKDIEVVIDPDMSNVTTVEWEDGNGDRYYTFTATITDLYCGIEMTVTEETDWSWRYTPGFTTSTTTQYADYDETDDIDVSDYSYVTPDAVYTFDKAEGETTVNAYYANDYTYIVANVVSENDDEKVVIRTVTLYVNRTVSEDDMDTLAKSFEGMTMDEFLESDEFPDETMTLLKDETSVMTVSTGGDITQTTTTAVDSYKIADFDEIHSGEVTLGLYTGDDAVGTTYDYYLTTMYFNSIATVTTSADGSSATVLVSNSESYLDKNGSNTDYETWERITELTYFGSELYSASGIKFSASDGTITYTPSSKATNTVGYKDENGQVTISTGTGDAYYIEKIYYYNDDGVKVYEILGEVIDGVETLTPNTYYQTTSVPVYVDDGEGGTTPLFDANDEPVYEDVESYAFQITEIPKSVPAVEFEIEVVDLEVFNRVTEEQWLSDSSLIENFFNVLDDPRTEEVE